MSDALHTSRYTHRVTHIAHQTKQFRCETEPNSIKKRETCRHLIAGVREQEELP